MSHESLLRTAEYFERRAKQARAQDERERLLAVARRYHARAKAERERAASDASEQNVTVRF
jgi:hypothetical protein